GEMIRLKGFGTAVLDNMHCESACALIWLGGGPRFIGKTARIGFHAAYLAQSGEVTSDGNALVGSYLNKIGLSDDAISYATSAAPNSMRYLTLADARRLGINVSVLSPSVASAAPSAKQIAPVAKSNSFPVTERLKQQSSMFVNALYRVTSKSSDTNLLARFYADAVNYFGKELPREQVLAQIQRFLARWPVRDYRPIESTVTIDCRESSLTCAVQGMIQFDAQSPLRNERSSGQATFEYLLRFATQDQPPKIIVENGSILKRNKTALHDTNSVPLWARPARD
ncbi:MAG: hypothetical protein ACM3W7_11525, partial [Acidobacteriota bacterium]